jgi:hypothetical protein
VADMDTHRHPDLPPGEGYEAKDATPRWVVFSGIGLMGLIILSLVAVAFLLGYFRSQSQAVYGPGPTPTFAQPPEPRLQVDPNQDLQSIRATQETQLNSYGWVNKNAGIAHISIDAAMQILAQRGLPTLAPTATGMPAPASPTPGSPSSAEAPAPTPTAGGSGG